MASAALSHRAPEEWAEFVAAFAEWTDHKRDECIGSNQETLSTTQGRAQACVELRKLFAECRQTAERVENKQNQRPSQPPRAAGSAWR